MIDLALQSTNVAEAVPLQPIQRVTRGSRLAELQRAVSALGQVGRNINQIARIAVQTGNASGASVSDLRAILRACEAMRVGMKELIRTNVASWEFGHAQTHS
jgi:hypothetical protein